MDNRHQPNNNNDNELNQRLAKLKDPQTFPKSNYLPHVMDSAAITEGERGLEKQSNALFRNDRRLRGVRDAWSIVILGFLQFRKADGPWNPTHKYLQNLHRGTSISTITRIFSYVKEKHMLKNDMYDIIFTCIANSCCQYHHCCCTIPITI